MALTSFFFFTISLLFFSLLLLVSATASDYGYTTKSYVDNSKSEDDGYGSKPDVYKPKPENHRHDYNTNPKKSEDKSKQEDDSYKPKPEDHGYIPNPTVYKPTKPEEKEKSLPVRIEGLVLCKSGLKNYPIQGAVAKITCSAVDDEHGYKTTPCSMYSTATDAKGYFVADLSQLILANGSKKKLTECRAYLDNSPLHDCNIPADVNKGITGALLSSFRFLNKKKIKLYWVGPFFFTPAHKSIPGGY
ncbi:hypothetical protein ACOSP7_032508 [Xanthoceras sorbifolium]|uniref:Pollen Ole e 1 allergen and extensin family protein n=1 Tax=Xanthoceras sorbifolium TaxID=99658 RepID=A0ABQ8H4B3_9ROSI|nr:hypothetical protein JRO89_XS14G0073400 [Xanthoceras sorbifolium]